MKRLVVAAVAAIGLTLFVSQTASAQYPTRAATMRAVRTVEQKREFLRGRMLAEVTDAIRLREMIRLLDGMNDTQLDALMDQYFDTLEARQAAASQRVGYAPVITTLPSGAAMGVGAVVSPDGRSVRVTASPFFSQVGGVSTFNMATGETRYYPPQPSYYPGYPVVPAYGNVVPRRQEERKPEYYHDGLRMRTR